MPSSMQTISGPAFKSFGDSSLQMPALGFGAAPMGNLYRAMSDDAAAATINAAFAQGINYVDTAPHYGFALSESRLGRAIVGKRNQLIISSKVGRLLMPSDSKEPVRHGFVNTPEFEPIFDYSFDAVMRSFESSLGRL